MLAGVINLGDVIELDLAVLVHIKLVVSGPDPLSSDFVEVALHKYRLINRAVTYLQEPEEFIEIDGAVAVSVEPSHQFLSFFFAQLESIVDEAPSEVVQV